MSVEIFDFGVELPENQRDKAKVFAWPLAAWKCYIPNSLAPDINILEKLVLSLISCGLAATKGDICSILCNQLHMNEELVKNVIESCTEKYMDKRHSNLTLNDTAQKMLSSMDEGISLKSAPSESMKSVYLFEDLISRRVVPCFSISDLPKVFMTAEDGTYIRIGEADLRKYADSQPKTSIINNAIRQWGRVSRRIQEGEAEENARVTIVETEPGREDMEEEANDAMDIAVPEEEVSENPLAAEGAKGENGPLKREEISRIAIYDDRPTKLYGKGYFVFDPDFPDEAEINSPFGPAYDPWFRTVVRHRLAEDDNFRTELQLFQEETIEKLKDKVAIRNDLAITLFDEFPPICNDNERFGLLKKAVEDLATSHAKILHGENESKHFAGDIRTAIEVLFKCAVKENPDLLQADSILAEGCPYPSPSNNYERKRNREIRKGRYVNVLTQLSHQIGMGDAIRETFTKSSAIFNNLESDLRKKEELGKTGNTKDLLAMIMVYASQNQDSKYWRFMKDFNKYLEITYEMMNLGNDALHSAKANITTQQANLYYAQFEMIVRSVYPSFLEVSNG